MAEKEYIEREAARNIFTPPLRDPESLDFWEWLQSEIDAIPAADVRPVVVCRDCKHNMANIPNFQDGININENWNACQLTELYDSVKPDDFCSHGVKREENK